MEALVLGVGAVAAVVSILVAAWRTLNPDGFVNPLHAPVAPQHTYDSLLTALREVSGGHDARAMDYSRGEEESGIELTVRGLCPKVALWRVMNVHAHRDSELVGTGDAEFDGVVEASGPPDQVHALLNAETRKAVRDLLGGSVRVGRFLFGDGELSVEVPTTGFARQHPGLPQVARAVGALSRHLATPEPVLERLAANARRDPVAGVRLTNLRVLLGRNPDDPLTLATLRAATTDPYADIRLSAALKLGAEGLQVLQSLATDDAVEDGCSAKAIGSLGEHFTLAEAQAVLQRASRAAHGAAGRPETLLACIAVLSRHRSGEAILLDMLARGEDAVRAGAARALGTVGSAAAVLPLKQAAAHGRGDFPNVARQAIAQIQSRLTGSPGELSLAEGEAGHLSLTEDSSGRVSLPVPENGEPPRR